jgi:hypothetical protein
MVSLWNFRKASVYRQHPSEMSKNILRKESLIEASRIFVTGNQQEKSIAIDRMFHEQPALMELIRYLDMSIKNELTKEVVIQLMSIFYKGFCLQGAKLNKINFEDFLASFSKSSEMKSYFHNPQYEFDGHCFKTFIDQYSQKEILNYTYFAINSQFREYIESEKEAIFIFYFMKTFGEVVGTNAIAHSNSNT